MEPGTQNGTVILQDRVGPTYLVTHYGSLYKIVFKLKILLNLRIGLHDAKYYFGVG